MIIIDQGKVKTVSESKEDETVDLALIKVFTTA